jgi:hypothetical protein
LFNSVCHDFSNESDSEPSPEKTLVNKPRLEEFLENFEEQV